jgi:hypothetical protein
MAGLVPAIHAAPLRFVFGFMVGDPAWMPATSTGMTRAGCQESLNHKLFA